MGQLTTNVVKFKKFSAVPCAMWHVYACYKAEMKQMLITISLKAVLQVASRSRARRYRASRFRANDAVVRACLTVTRPASSRLATL